MSRRLVPTLFLAVAVGRSLPGAEPAAARPLPQSQAQWEERVRQQPDDVEALYQLGTRLVDTDQPEAAVKLLEHAAALAPTDARVQDELGAAYGGAAEKASVFSKFGLARRCQAAFENAVRLAPKNPSYRLNLFTYDLMAPALVGGGTDKALAQAKALLEFAPLEGHRALGQLYAAQERYPDALAEYRAALQLAPADYGALFGLGRTAALSGLAVDEGLAALQQCLARPAPPALPPHAAVYWRLGNLEERQQQVARARADYQAALHEDPNFKPARESLAKLPAPP